MNETIGRERDNELACDEGSEVAMDVTLAAKATLPGSVIEQILLRQPLNPLVKLEFTILPRSA